MFCRANRWPCIQQAIVTPYTHSYPSVTRWCTSTRCDYLEGKFRHCMECGIYAGHWHVRSVYVTRQYCAPNYRDMLLSTTIECTRRATCHYFLHSAWCCGMPCCPTSRDRIGSVRRKTSTCSGSLGMPPWWLSSRNRCEGALSHP